MPQLSRIRSFKVFQSTRCSRRQPLKELLFHQTHVELNARLAAELRLSKIPCVCVWMDLVDGGGGRLSSCCSNSWHVTLTFDVSKTNSQRNNVDAPGRGSWTFQVVGRWDRCHSPITYCVQKDRHRVSELTNLATMLGWSGRHFFGSWWKNTTGLPSPGDTGELNMFFTFQKNLESAFGFRQRRARSPTDCGR